MSDTENEPTPENLQHKPLSVSALSVRVRNLLLEFDIGPFCLIGFRGQDAIEVNQFEGELHLRALNDLFKETYRTNFEDLPEYEMEWDDDDTEDWKKGE